MVAQRYIRFGALPVTLMLVLAACGTASPSASAGAPSAGESIAESMAESVEPAADLNIVFIPKAVNNPYFDAAAVGGQEAAADLGGEFTQIGGQDSTPDEQIPYIQDATTQGYSAIVVSATGPDEIAPALQEALAQGIKVVGYDSAPAVGAYDVFVNQVDFSLIGASMAQWACDLAPECTGQVAILSATATAPNQNAWIADFETALTLSDFSNLELVDTVYGDDDPQTSTEQAQGLLQSYPNLRVIVAPTTVGILAAAQVVTQQGSDVKVTGLGLPNDMNEYVHSGVSPEFGLWSVPDLGKLAYYVAAYLIDGTISGAVGETFTVPGLNDDQPYTIEADNIVTLGPPFQFDETNIDDFDF